MTFFTADTHFGHTAIIDMCGRPFDDADDMDSFTIDMWNSKVNGNDTVYIVGDMFYRHKDPESVLIQLKGKKRLIIGNHDASWMKKVDCSKYFITVSRFDEVSDGKHGLVLCHYPLMTWEHPKKNYMIHGHIHNNTDMSFWPVIRDNPRLLNAGVDVNGFWPVTFEELVINNECFKEGLRIGECGIL